MDFMDTKAQILDLPLNEVIRPEIALPLQHMLKIYTVGSFLRAWENPASQPHIAHLFASAAEAHQAVALCATWAGWSNVALPASNQKWMRAD
jgi:hypothetical protein